MTEFSQKPLTRYDLTLWFLRAILLEQVINVVWSVGQMVLGSAFFFRGLGFSNGAFSLGTAFGTLALWFLAPMLVRGAVGDQSESGAPSWKSLLFPCLGLALIATNLGNLVTQTIGLGFEFVRNDFSLNFGTGGGFDPISFMAMNFLTSGSRFLLGLALAFLPALRQRFRNAGA